MERVTSSRNTFLHIINNLKQDFGRESPPKMCRFSDSHSPCFGSWRKWRGETFIKYPSGRRSIPPTLCFRHPSTLSPCEIILIKVYHPLMTDLPPAGKIHSPSSQFCQPQITPQCIQYVYLSAGCMLLLDFWLYITQVHTHTHTLDLLLWRTRHWLS